MAISIVRPNARMAKQPSAVVSMLKPHKDIAVKLILFSGIINLMALSVSLYMMQVYDRVLGSQSKDTLYFLTLAVILAIGLSASLEAVRQQVANRVGTWFSQNMGPMLLARSLEQRLTMPNTRLEALRQLNTVKSFISTPTLFNVVDMLWVPLYLVVIFTLHPLFGLIAGFGAIALFTLTYLNERITRQAIRSNQSKQGANMQYAESLVRNSEVIDAMGMSDQTVAHWSIGLMEETSAADATQQTSIKFVAVTKFVRNAIQVTLLGTGALLILDQELTGGAMIAGSIIVARLLAPIEASMTYWKQLVLARDAFQRLTQFCEIPRPRPSEMTLPKPAGAITVSQLTYVPLGQKNAILRGVNFQIAPGTMLAIVGPSASGKTTLSRMIVGVLKPTNGHVRLDGAETFDWKRSDFGRYVGYLPQDIELIPGTVRQNIARFRTDASDEDIVAAAKLADCHELILQLENGYDCLLGDQALQLSGGQRQRIGLARALFGMPQLVVLDEPNSSLDAKGDAALMATLSKLKALKITTVVVSHRANLLRLADKIMVMMEGRVTTFGNAPDVIAELGGEKPSGPPKHIRGEASQNSPPAIPAN
ncbi:MAG: type I secretion system permease/ATPase [Sphingomonadales bacterium]|nr:type I secretion system permease/ATPase [Sphingomonadales bacterium]